MAHGTVTVGTARLTQLNIAMPGYLADGNGMAVHTIMLEGIEISRTNTNRFAKILEGKGLGMVPAVVEFDEVFLRQGMRHVAIIAGSGHAVARLGPGIIVLPHDVTVHAGLGLIAEVREPLGILKGITS
jgi:hypothetical protein